MSRTVSDRAALAAYAEAGRRVTDMARLLWPDDPGWAKPRCVVLRAGRVLARLRREGLVTSTGTLTEKGVRLLGGHPTPRLC